MRSGVRGDRSRQNARRTCNDEPGSLEFEIESDHLRRAGIPAHRVGGDSQPSDSAGDQSQIILQLLKRMEALENATKQDKPQRSAGVECFYCHERGHYARECPKKKNKMQSNDSRGSTSNDPLNRQGPSLAARGGSH